MTYDFDVLIIGSGAGGGMAALRLCENGFKVGLVERGPRFDPKKDYILNHDDWEMRRDPLDDARRNEQTIDRSHRTSIQISGQERERSALNYHRVHGVGGSTLHYQGEAHRFAEHSFNTLEQFGYGADWPINYADLQPYYRQAEQLLGVAGEPDNPFKVTRAGYPTPAHPLSQCSRVLANGAATLGWKLQANPLALPSKSMDGRLPCQHSGGCNYGCVFKAKSSIDQAIIPRAEKTGKLTLITETQVRRLELNSSGDIVAVACVATPFADTASEDAKESDHRTNQKGSTQTQAKTTSSRPESIRLSAKRYVLAGGAIETPRLMLASANASQPNGLGNQFDQVGRYFMETVLHMTGVEFEHDIRSYSGPPIDSRIWDFCKPMDNKTSGFVLGSAGYLNPSTGPYHHATRQPGLGRAHKQRVRDTFGKNLWLFGITEQEPNASNRISLSKAADPAGLAKVKVHCEYSERDQHTLNVMRNKIEDWVIATGGMRIKQSQSSRRVSAATHVGGTCRMGKDPHHSVVDIHGKVHGSRNTYITDASVLPTQGMGDSPSLTIQALALRSADFITQDMRLEKA